MAKDEVKSPAQNDNPPAEAEATAPKGWESEQTGLAPYWIVEVGASFQGIVLERDVSDPEFVRYNLQATRPVE